MEADALETFLSIGEVHVLPRGTPVRDKELSFARFRTASDLRQFKPDNVVLETLRMKLGTSLGVVGATAFTVGDVIGDAVRKNEMENGNIVLNIPDSKIDQPHEGALKPSQTAFRVGQTDGEIKACALCVFFPNDVRNSPATKDRVMFVRKMGYKNFYAVADLINGTYVAKFMGEGDATND